MENVKEVVQQIKNLPVSTQTSTELTQSNNELSVYKDRLTTKGVIMNVAKIKKSFPGLPIGFYQVFDERLKANNFTDERLTDAVNHVIDTCIYPTPTIANFISFDRRIKVYTYAQYCKLCDEGDGNNYHPVAINNNVKPVWAHENDIKQFNLKLWQNEKPL
jgi:hypothetical protein